MLKDREGQIHFTGIYCVSITVCRTNGRFFCLTSDRGRREERKERKKEEEGWREGKVGGQKTSKVSSRVLVIYLVFIFFTVSSCEYHVNSAEKVE